MTDESPIQPFENRNTLWGRAIVEELVRAGVEAVCLAPGSRSTPLVVAAADHTDLRVFGHLDERSAAFFALGRAKRTGNPCPVITTSGTAAANLHPAIIEADESRVPMLAMTADRPVELRESGANQTVDQQHLFGRAVRWYRELPEPAPESRRLRSVRTIVSRAVATSRRVPAGPVHLNMPFAKPLEPTPVPDDVPPDFGDHHPTAVRGRTGPFFESVPGVSTLDSADADAISRTLQRSDRGLIVCGPTDREIGDPVRKLAHRTGFPILADPLSGLRFDDRNDASGIAILGGYDSWLSTAITESWPAPDLVLRFGANPTSARLQRYLARSGAEQLLIDPAGEWREAAFAGGRVVEVDPTAFASAMADRLPATPVETDWRRRFERTEAHYWSIVDERTDVHFEGGVLADALDRAPDPATVFVSNSMPIRDVDRFARPTTAVRRLFGNRGASGIDGIPSTGLGVASALDETADGPLVLCIGDLALYHDMNGLLAIDRFDLDATIVLLNNDGGGIFHLLPIEAFDPPFTDRFKTPHGLDFGPVASMYGIEYDRVEHRREFRRRYDAALASDDPTLIEVVVDAEASHAIRESIQSRVESAIVSDGG